MGGVLWLVTGRLDIVLYSVLDNLVLISYRITLVYSLRYVLPSLTRLDGTTCGNLCVLVSRQDAIY